MLNEVLHQIERRQKFILTSHARPDGDAVGSTLACAQILRTMGKQACVVLRDGVPGTYGPLPFADTVLRDTDQAPDAEAVIILECDSVARTRLTGIEQHYLINIDHHETARPFADVNWIDPHACATAEMIFRLARHKAVNQFEYMLQRAGRRHRQAAPQQGKQHDEDHRDQNLHHHEIGPRFGGVCRVLVKQGEQPVSQTSKMRVEDLRQPGFMSDHR